MTDDGIQMSFRLSSELHYACKESAEGAGQTLAEWIRRAMREKLEREKMVAVPHTELSPEQDADVEEIVRALIEKVLAEKGL